MLEGQRLRRRTSLQARLHVFCLPGRFVGRYVFPQTGQLCSGQRW
jgi:hypothetical protein